MSITIDDLIQDAVENAYIYGAAEVAKRISDLVSGPSFPLAARWKVGERVEHVNSKGPYGPDEVRPGVVSEIRPYLQVHEHLVVRFDDGEERAINPDMMRHPRRRRG